jgi:hypothetical protein
MARVHMNDGRSFFHSFLKLLLFCGFLSICGIGVFLFSGVRDEQQEWARSEPKERADFEKRFPVPAYLPADAGEQKRMVRRAIVARELLADVERVLAAKQELARSQVVVEHADYEGQVAKVTAAQKKFDGLVSAFGSDIHLVNRFAQEDLYGDIEVEIDRPGGLSSWCFTADRLRRINLSGFLGFSSFGDVQVPAVGCRDD